MADLGLFILFSLTIVTAILSYRFIENYFVACFASSIVTSIVFQIIGYFSLGYIDPFVMISTIVSAFYALLISAIVGFIFWRRRVAFNQFKNKKEQQSRRDVRPN